MAHSWTSARLGRGCPRLHACVARCLGPAWSFWPGTSARMSPGYPQDIRRENFLIGLLFVSIFQELPLGLPGFLMPGSGWPMKRALLKDDRPPTVLRVAQFFRKCQFVHNIACLFTLEHHNFGSLLPPPPLPTSQVMDLLLNLYWEQWEDLKQNCEHSTKILPKLRTTKIMNKRAFLNFLGWKKTTRNKEHT